MPTPSVVSIPGKGWDLQIAPSGAYATVGGVKSISGPDIKKGTRDTTHLLSTWKECAPTISDGGTVTCDVMMNWADAQQSALNGLLTTHPSSGINVKFIGATTTVAITFNATLTAFAVSGMEVEGTVMAKISFQVNGPVTLPYA